MLARPGWDEVFAGLVESYRALRPAAPGPLPALGLTAWEAPA